MCLNSCRHSSSLYILLSIVFVIIIIICFSSSARYVLFSSNSHSRLFISLQNGAVLWFCPSTVDLFDLTAKFNEFLVFDSFVFSFILIFFPLHINFHKRCIHASTKQIILAFDTDYLFDASKFFVISAYVIYYKNRHY